MASTNIISDTTSSPTKTPAEIITRAERDLARESVKALVAVPLGVVVPMPEGGDE